MAAVPPLSQSDAIPSPRVGPNPFSFGSVIFTTADGPSSLAIGGGEQKRAVAELVGGGRVVHATGFQPSIYEFSGTLNQPNIYSTIATLRRYAVDAKERLVTWKGERYYGILALFSSPIFKNGGNRCEWRIGLEVTRDANGVFSGVAPKASVDDANAKLLNGANANVMLVNANVAATDAQTTSILANTQASLIASGVAIQQATPSVSASAANLSGASNAITGSLAVAQQLAARFASTHGAFVPSQAIVAALTILGANLRSVQFQNVAQQQGGSLYALASTKYGDVSRAFDLMRANGVTSPRLSGNTLQTVVLPPFSPK